MTLLTLPLALQAIAIVFDEFYFHYKRSPLPNWERFGHPIDTLSVILTLSILLIFPEEEFSSPLYWSAAAFSCALITKDEWIHHKLCTAGEQWLHAILFILHPISFYVLFEISKNPEWTFILWVQFLILTIFWIYQLLRGLFS